eukprot:scaffold8994_cov184-Skeletonema_dohrnii-CCMP3373.AAC.3
MSIARCWEERANDGQVEERRRRRMRWSRFCRFLFPLHRLESPPYLAVLLARGVVKKQSN